jgi:prevent-host-death family protein
MEVGIRELRAHLSRYLIAVRGGSELTVTDHGKAVARLVPLDQPRVIDRLIADGLVTPASASKAPRQMPEIVPARSITDLLDDARG